MDDAQPGDDTAPVPPLPPTAPEPTQPQPTQPQPTQPQPTQPQPRVEETSPYASPSATPPAYSPEQPAYGYPQPFGQAPGGGQMAAYPGTAGPGAGPIGQVRGTGICILLFIVTLGIYGYVWYFKTHDEMKRHSGSGLGGGVALVLAIFVGIAMPYITSSEVGQLYTRRGQHPPVTGLTGLWSFPGSFILVGPVIWFVKTNGALNEYWRSLGAA